MRTWDPLPPDWQFKEYLSEAQRVPAKREHWCAFCGKKIAVDADMQFVRWSAAPDAYTALHGKCWDDLPLKPENVAAPNSDDGPRRAYDTGQRERANGVVEYLQQQGEDAWMEKLPDGERHRDSRYVVYVKSSDGYDDAKLGAALQRLRELGKLRGDGYTPDEVDAQLALMDQMPERSA